jgi:hypothetical protein
VVSTVVVCFTFPQCLVTNDRLFRLTTVRATTLLNQKIGAYGNLFTYALIAYNGGRSYQHHIKFLIVTPYPYPVADYLLCLVSVLYSPHQRCMPPCFHVMLASNNALCDSMFKTSLSAGQEGRGQHKTTRRVRDRHKLWLLVPCQPFIKW